MMREKILNLALFQCKYQFEGFGGKMNKIRYYNFLKLIFDDFIN